MEAIFTKEIIIDKVACRVLGIITFIILTSLGAFVRIPLPFTPVPVTLQTFFVLLSGALLGKGYGAVSQTAYLALGVAGLPIFAQAGFGAAYLFGPTGGYLAGFVLASLFLGRSIKYARCNFFGLLGLFLAADFIILASGTFWLKIILGYGFFKLLAVGFVPFVLPDILKAAFAALLYLRLKGRLTLIFGQ